jgi:ABC-type hemin transport system ATPase subunit
MIMKDGKVYGVGVPEDMITKEILESVYGCEVFVDENPVIAKPRVTLVGE